MTSSSGMPIQKKELDRNFGSQSSFHFSQVSIAAKFLSQP